MPAIHDSHGSDDSPAGRLLTLEHHLKWEAKYAAELAEAVAGRNASLNEAESARFAQSVDAVVRELQPMRKRGLSLDEAGAELQHTWGRYRAYSYSDLVTVLHRLGWKPGAKSRAGQWEPARG